MNNLAVVLEKLNQLKQSEELYKETLDFCKKNLLPDDPLIEITLNNFALVLQKQGRYDEVMELFKE